MKRPGPFTVRLGRSLALLGMLSTPVSAQETSPAFDASPLLPPDHWAVRAAWRAEALGLAPGFMPAQRAVPRAAVAAALEEAGARARSGSPYAALTAGWRARFAEEFSEHREGTAGARLLGGSAGAGVARTEGRLSPAWGHYTTRELPDTVPDARGGYLMLAGGAAARPAAAYADLRVDPGGFEARHWEAVAAAGPISLSVGRAVVAYGAGDAGGIVLGGSEPLPRVEVQTTQPLALPGFLAPLGRATFHTFATRLDDGRHAERPWLWGARAAVRPHERLTLAVNRAAIFGGEHTRMGPRELLEMLLGVLSEDFENQIVSAEGRWRLPTDAVVPATAYVEWGAEDGAGAWWAQPALSGGIFLPALPWAPEVSAGVEGAYFAPCCEHGVWYTHGTFLGNWARGRALLGHPLGGEGREGAVYGSAALRGGRLHLEGRAFVRRRAGSPEGIPGGGNLFAPSRAGTGVGGTLSVLLRVAERTEAMARIARDGVRGSAERRFEAQLRYLFP